MQAFISYFFACPSYYYCYFIHKLTSLPNKLNPLILRFVRVCLRLHPSLVQKACFLAYLPLRIQTYEVRKIGAQGEVQSA